MTKRTPARKLTPTQARVFEQIAAAFYGQATIPALYGGARLTWNAAVRVLVERGLIVDPSTVGGSVYRLTDAGREHANR